MEKFLYQWFLPFVTACLISFLLYLALKDYVYVIDGGGMNPNFFSGEIVIVKNDDGIRRNDIVMIKNPLVKSTSDKKHTLKRCVALPGDTVKIFEKKLFVNGKPQDESFCQCNRKILFFSKDEIRAAHKRYGIFSKEVSSMDTVVPITEKLFLKIQTENLIKNISTEVMPKDMFDRHLFPYSTYFSWNRDFYGVLVVPKKGMTVKMNVANAVFYKFILEKYEAPNLQVKDGKLYVNGKVSDSYCFKHDYYFLLNDFRDDVSDSRTFGPVPEDFITGKFFMKL